MELSELESTPSVQDDTPEYTDDDQSIVDLNDALTLLGKTLHLLNYVSEPDLVKTLSKRERGIMRRLGIQIREFLDEVAPSYAEAGRE